MPFTYPLYILSPMYNCLIPYIIFFSVCNIPLLKTYHNSSFSRELNDCLEKEMYIILIPMYKDENILSQNDK